MTLSGQTWGAGAARQLYIYCTSFTSELRIHLCVARAHPHLLSYPDAWQGHILICCLILMRGKGISSSVVLP